MQRRVLLIGMMGAGKTTAGRFLAERIGSRYVDSDEEVERNTGRTVPEIFAGEGEAVFRSEESRALSEAVASEGPLVVSVAGGAVLDPVNRDLIRSAGSVVWLRAPVRVLAGRVGAGLGRPLLDDEPTGALARLYEERRPLYEELADIVVDVEELTPEEVVEEILRQLP
ncbi:MAG TPA: shikimate kinase [Acidimicrobiales bacterium]|nr:shikimate kinase [Acidimicrobiales bacterium]